MRYEGHWTRLDGNPSKALQLAVKAAIEENQMTIGGVSRFINGEAYHRDYNKLNKPRTHNNTFLDYWFRRGLGYTRIKITVEVE